MIFKNFSTGVMPSFHLCHQYHYHVLLWVNSKIRSPGSKPAVTPLATGKRICFNIFNHIECKAKMRFGNYNFWSLVYPHSIGNLSSLMLSMQTFLTPPTSSTQVLVKTSSLKLNPVDVMIYPPYTNHINPFQVTTALDFFGRPLLVGKLIRYIAFHGVIKYIMFAGFLSTLFT